MEENTIINVLQAKLKGYVIILKGLGDEVASMYNDMIKYRDILSNDIKSDNADYKNVKKELNEYDATNIKASMISNDIESYLIKVGTIKECIETLGYKVNDMEDEDLNKIVETSELLLKDVFTYSMEEGKLIVVNTESYNEFMKSLNERSSSDDVAKQLYKKAQEILQPN